MAETRRPSGAGSLGTLVENEKVAKNIIAEVAVNGYNIHKSKIVEEGTYYRTFILLEFPIGDANDIMMSLIKRNNEVEARVRAKRAHKELDKDVNKVQEHEIEKQKIVLEELNR
jgi:glycine cleavage system regulatory protein